MPKSHAVIEPQKADLRARSISRRVWEQIEGETLVTRVLAVFDRACSLVTSDGTVATLVLPQIGDGPLNIVIDGEQGVFAAVKPGMPAHLTGRHLQVGELVIALSEARVWEPRALWERLRVYQRVITQRLALLQSIALSKNPQGSLLTLLTMGLSESGGLQTRRSEMRGGVQGAPSDPLRQDLALAFLASALAGAEALQIGWKGDTTSLREGATQLAGLGSGLTPAGDDFLIGFMLWAWLAHPTPRRLCYEIIEMAAPRTTILSAAFLRAAAEGECSAAWHHLLDALAKGREDQLVNTATNVLSHGHTSGADTLTGFLWMSSSLQVGPAKPKRPSPPKVVVR